MRGDDLSGLRIAIYARYSTEKQSTKSVDDQVRECGEYLERRGVDLSGVQVFMDRGESGTSLQRGGGIESLIAATERGLVNCVVVEHMDRITRDMADGMSLWREWAFRRVRLIGIVDGVDSAQPGAKMVYAFSMIQSDQFIENLRHKTRRGMIGRVHAGRLAGPPPYGYGSKPAPDGIGKVAVIDSEQAAIVRRMFEEFAGGRSPPSIASALNEEGVTPPRGNGRRKRNGWVASGVRAILLNAKYIGDWRFNEREYVKVPGTKRRISRPRPASEVIAAKMPELRLIPDEVWEVAQKRFEENAKRYGKKRPASSPTSLGRAGKPSQYLLSGLLICGECGGPMTIHGGAKGRRYYRCDDNAKRGICANSLSVRESIARERILGGLQETLASSAAVLDARRIIATELAAARRSGNTRQKKLEAELARARERIERLTEAVASGRTLESLLDKLEEEERTAKRLRVELDEIMAASGGPIRLPTVEEGIRLAFDLQKRLGDDDVEGNREAIRRLLRRGVIRLVPGEDGIYEAQADVLPFGLLLVAPQDGATTPASNGDGRSTTSDCGGRI